MDNSATVSAKSLSEVVEVIERELRQGAHHGFFDLQVAVSVVHGDRRQITVKCGRSWRFVLRREELNQ